MEFSNGETPSREAQLAAPPLPRVWIGYLLGVVTILAEIIAVQLHPELAKGCLLYTSPSPRDLSTSRMPSSA